MAKRVLVIDNGCFGAEGYFQYAIVDFDGDFKNVHKYDRVDKSIHSVKIASFVQDLFDSYRCDEIYMDTFGSDLCVVECMNHSYLKNIIGYRLSAARMHESICKFRNDVMTRNIFIDRNATELYVVLTKYSSTYECDRSPFLKLDKHLTKYERMLWHMVLSIYHGIDGVPLLEDEVFKDRYSKY